MTSPNLKRVQSDFAHRHMAERQIMHGYSFGKKPNPISWGGLFTTLLIVVALLGLFTVGAK